MKVAARVLLGHIDCPCCGHEKGMRVTLDKNGEPFGYCEANCSQQMRVGGDAMRVAAFYRRHPHLHQGAQAAQAPAAAPVTVSAPVPAPAPAAKAKAPPPPPAPRASANPFDFLLKGAGA